MTDATPPCVTAEVSATTWWVVCLCADWCGVCRDYRPGFEALAQRWPTMRVEWLDVEDREDLVEDVDVETFPTLLIGQGGNAFFFGPLLPQHQVLERLIATFVDGSPASAQLDPAATPLFQRVVKALDHGGKRA